MIKAHILVTTVFTAGLLHGCGGSSGDTKIDQPFLAASDLIPNGGSVESLSATEFAEALLDEKFIYNESNIADDEDDVSACVDNLVGDFELEVSGNTVSSGGSADIGSCLSLPTNVTANIERSEVVYFFRITCNGGDLTLLQETDGLSFRDIEDAGDLSDLDEIECDSFASLSNMRFAFDIVGTNQSGQVTSIASRGAAYQGVDSNTACVINVDGSNVDGSSVSGNKEIYQNGCTDFSLSNNAITGSDGAVTELYEKTELVMSNIVGSDGSTWFDSGNIAVDLKGWSGTLTYEGEGRSPVFVGQSTEGETFSGQIDDSILLADAAQSYKTPPKLLRTAVSRSFELAKNQMAGVINQNP